MSADKDRGIRREKQKRAKDKKKQVDPQHKPTDVARSLSTKASAKRVA